MISIHVFTYATYVHIIQYPYDSPVYPMMLGDPSTTLLADLLQEACAASSARGEAICLQGDADAGGSGISSRIFLREME
jgi:hypothetical protein